MSAPCARSSRTALRASSGVFKETSKRRRAINSRTLRVGRSPAIGLFKCGPEAKILGPMILPFAIPSFCATIHSMGSLPMASAVVTP